MRAADLWKLLQRIGHLLYIGSAGNGDQLPLQELIPWVGLPGCDTLPIRIARLLEECPAGVALAGAQRDLGALVRDQPARHGSVTVQAILGRLDQRRAGTQILLSARERCLGRYRIRRCLGEVRIALQPLAERQGQP